MFARTPGITGLATGRLTAIALAMMIAAAPLFTGCGGTDDADALVNPQAPTAAFGTAPPTLAELQAAVSLTSEQSNLIEPLLARWHDAHQQRQELRRQRRSSGGGPHMGPGQGGPRKFGDREPLFLVFLEDCAGVLDSEQFTDLVEFLGERQAAHFQNREGRRGGRGHGGGGMCAGGALGLDESQRAAFRDAMHAAREVLRSSRQDYADGSATAQDVHDQAAQAVVQLREALQEILSEDQFNTVTEHMSERTARMAERRLEHLGEGIERRVGFLTKVLDLDETEVQAVQDALATLLPRWEELFAGIQTGDVAFADALYQSILIHEAAKDILGSILDEEQMERLGMLRRLLPGPRPIQIYL